MLLPIWFVNVAHYIKEHSVQVHPSETTICFYLNPMIRNQIEKLGLNRSDV